MEGNAFHNDPGLGFSVTTLIVIFTEFFKVMDHRMPPLIMDLFQMLAWGAAIMIGLITLHGWYVKNFKKKTDGENKSGD